MVPLEPYTSLCQRWRGFEDLIRSFPRGTPEPPLLVSSGPFKENRVNVSIGFYYLILGLLAVLLVFVLVEAFRSLGDVTDEHDDTA